MAIHDIYSKRFSKTPDVYVYDDVPERLRIKIIHIIRDALGSPIYRNHDESDKVYEAISDVLCREHGWLRLPQGGRSLSASGGYEQRVTNFS